MYFKIARGVSNRVLREVAAAAPSMEKAAAPFADAIEERRFRKKNNTRKSRELHFRLIRGFERTPNTLLLRDNSVNSALDQGRSFDRAAVVFTMHPDTTWIGGENGHEEDVVKAAVTTFRTNNNLFVVGSECTDVFFRKHAIARFAERQYESHDEFDKATFFNAIPDAVLMANLMRFDFSHIMKNVPVPCGDGILLGYDIRDKEEEGCKVSCVGGVEKGRKFKGEAGVMGYPSKTYYNTFLGVADLNYAQLKLRDSLREFIEKHRKAMIDLVVHAKFGMSGDFFGVSGDCIFDMMSVTEDLHKLKETPEWAALGGITREGVLQEVGIEARQEMNDRFGGQTRDFAFHEPLVNQRAQNIILGPNARRQREKFDPERILSELEDEGVPQMRF